MLYLYLTLKSVHIIGFVSWFAALFIYHVFLSIILRHIEKEQNETNSASIKTLSEQFKIMESRLYTIIMTPAMIVTFICGFSMIGLNGFDWLEYNMWMIYKIGLSFYWFLPCLV